MTVTPRLRERLSGAAAALAVQAGLGALLVLSFEVIRRMPEEKETILFLPRLEEAPMVIDGRPKPPPRSGATMPPRLATPPAAAPPAQDGGNAVPPDLGGASTGCRPESAGRECPPFRRDAPRPDTATLTPPSPVKDEARWAEEHEAARTPPRVPCVSLQTTGIGMGGFHAEEHSVMVDPLCAVRELFHVGAAEPQSAPAREHVSEAAFQKALAAVQQRQKALYGRLAAAPQAGGAP